MIGDEVDRPLELPFADADGDLVGDQCDICPGSDDLSNLDYDDVPPGCDVCPYGHDSQQLDSDGDGTGDECEPLSLTLLSVSVTAGLSAEVDGAPENHPVGLFLGIGEAEVGECESEDHAGLCLAVPGRPTTYRTQSDGTGLASFAGELPASAVAGSVVTVQAAIEYRFGGVTSEPIEIVVAP